MPLGVSAARQLTLGPWFRGTAPTTRSPRGARPRGRVRLVCVLVSSRKTSVVGLTAAMLSRHAARAAASRSLAIRDFF
jgi:hypothetical protein